MDNGDRDDSRIISLALITIAPGRRTIDDDAVAVLAKSIIDQGLINPITVTPDGHGCYRLIAGAHRLAAYRSLDRTEIWADVLDVDELRAQLIEIDENLIRKDLSALERGEQLARRKEIYEGLHPQTKHGKGRTKQDAPSASCSFAKDTETKTGQAERTIQESVQLAKDIPQEVRDAIRGTFLADRQKDLLALAQIKDKEKQKEIVEKILDAKSEAPVLVREATRQIRAEKKRVERTAAQAVIDPKERPHLIHGRFQEAKVEDNSIDWIITDPPYGVAYEELYGEFSEWADRVLRPGGSALVMIGQVALPRMLNALCSSLKFHWPLCWTINEGSPGTTLPQFHVISMWKPVIWLCKGLRPDTEFMNPDRHLAGTHEKQKDHHAWQQSDYYFDWLVSKYTRNDQVVADPFMGWGTVGMSAKRFGRRFLGIEQVRERYEEAGRRIDATEVIVDGKKNGKKTMESS